MKSDVKRLNEKQLSKITGGVSLYDTVVNPTYLITNFRGTTKYKNTTSITDWAKKLLRL